MPLLQNLSILALIILVVVYALPTFQFIILLYYKFRFQDYKLVSKDKLSKDILEIILPTEEFLLSNGFVFQNVVTHNSSMVGNNTIFHIIYYFNSSNGVHAFINTQPFKGALESFDVSFETIFQSKKIVITNNGKNHTIPAIPDDIYFFDHYLTSVEEIYNRHLIDRQIEDEEVTFEVFDAEGLIAYQSYIEKHFIQSWQDEGYAKIIADEYRFRVSFKLFVYATRFIKGHKKYTHILKNSNHQQNGQKYAISSQVAQIDKPRGEGDKKKWFIISMIAFSVFFGILGFGILDILALLVVLLVHELGHFLAMRYFGYTDTAIFFMPFGAVTTGTKKRRVAFEEFVVALAGPLPGILIGIFILISVTQYNLNFDSSFFNTYAMFSIMVNYVNLLPIYPLDGGRIIQTLFLLRFPKGQFYFYIFSLALLTIAMLFTQDFILLFFVIILSLGVKNSYRISNIIKTLFQNKKQEEITKEYVIETMLANNNYAKESLDKKSHLVSQIMTLLYTSKASKKLIFFGGLLYTLLFLPIFYSWIIFYFSINSSPIISTKIQKEFTNFEQNIMQYRGLSSPDSITYSLDDSMKILDNYITKHSSRVPQNIDTTPLPCDIPYQLQQIYNWHNGIMDIIPLFSRNSSLLSQEKLIQTYIDITKENQKFGDVLSQKVFVIGHHTLGLAYSCKEEGLFDYFRGEYQERAIKEYYDFNHFLKITAEAYKAQAYYHHNGRLKIDNKELHKIKKLYLSQIDKERYYKLLEFLKNKSQEYVQLDELLQIMVLREIGNTYEAQMIPFVQPYLTNKNERVAKQAEKVLERLY